MAVTSNSVEVRINVVDETSAPAVSHAIQNIKQIGAAGAQVQGQFTGTIGTFQQFGVSGTVAGRIVKQSMDGVRESMLSATEQTRLTSEVMGVRLPRAMISLISQSEAAQAVIGGLSTAMIGLAGVQIGAMVLGAAVGEVKNLYERWLDVDGAIQRYNDDAAKAASQKFDADRSLQQINDDLRTANQLIDELTQKKAKLPTASQFFSQNPAGFLSYKTLEAMGIKKDAYGGEIKNPYFSVENAKVLNSAQGQSDKDSLAAEQKRHVKALAAIRDTALIDEAGLAGIAKARRAQKAADDEALEDTKNRFNVQNQLAAVSERAGKKLGEEGYIPRPGAHDFDVEQNAAQAHAAAQFRAQSIEDARQTEDAMRRIHMQAEEADASPIRRLEIERKAADEEWVRQHGQNAAVIADIDRRFYVEEKTLAKEAADKQIAEANRWLQSALEVAAKRERAQREFGQHVDRNLEEMSTRAEGGIARIHANADRAIADMRAEFANAPGANPKDLDRYVAGVRISEGDQVADMQRRNAEETSQLEAEARAKFLNSEKNQAGAIEDEYEQRLHKFQEWKDQELSSDKLSFQERQSINEQFDRRVAAAGQVRDAEMVESAQRAREKMAGQFSRFFQNPIQAMKEFGDKAAGEAAAALMQRMQGRIAGGGSTRELLGLPGSGDWMSGIFSHIAGSPHSRAPHGVEARASMNPTGLLSIGAAQIRVGSASIALGGGGMGSGFTPGSTSLFGGPRLSSAVYSSGGGTAAGFGFGGGTAGGAGDMGFGGANTLSFGAPAGSAGSMPAGPGVASQVMSGANQGLTLFKQAKGLFSSGSGVNGSDAGAGMAETQSVDLSGSINKAGNFNLGKSGSTLFNGGGMGAAAGAAGGAMGMFSAFEGNGGIGGALQGGMAGFQLGMSVGGPIGAAIGAGAGAIIGAIGFGGREKARVYDLKTVRPRIESDMAAYQQDTMDYMSAYSDLQSADVDAHNTLRKMGGAAHKYYWDTVVNEFHQAEGKLNAEQRAGRSNYTAQAAQYDVGTDAVPRDGLAVIHRNERIFPSDQNERITRAIESGASTRMAAQSGFGGDIHIHGHMIDPRGFDKLIDASKHKLRAAINASFAENSGGADAY